MAPVDPASLTFGQRSDQKTVDSKRKNLGLDEPLHRQLVYYLRDLSPIVILDKDHSALASYDYRSIRVSGSKLLILKLPYLRESYQTDRSVAAILFEAIPLTIVLAFSAFAIACILGMFLGVLAALHKDQWIDRLIVGISTFGYSVPSYVSAIVMAFIFGYVLAPYTGLNIQGSLKEINDIGDDIWVPQNVILPALALGIRPVSVIAQLMRSAFLDIYGQAYVRTAFSKGIRRIDIIKYHVMRNAMNPVVTALSSWFASLLAGAFFVENVFNYRGMGLVTVQALINYDIPVILACVIFISLIFIIVNISVDYIYKLLDPRVVLD